MTEQMTCAHIIVGFTRNEPIDQDSLEGIAELCLDRLNADARFLAFGPVVSANFERSAIELECSVCGNTVEEMEANLSRIKELVLSTIASIDYATTEERVAVPA